MKAWFTAVTLMVLGTLAGCGGGGNGISNANLTQAQARQVGATVSNDVSKALASAVGSPAVPLDITTRDKMLVALQRNNSQANAVSKPEDVTCSGSTCTVSGTFNCPDGGSILVSGNFTASGTSASGTFTETLTNCSDGTLIINDGKVTAGLQSTNDGMTTTVNVMINGNVSFSPVQAGQFPMGTCSITVTAGVSVNDSSGSVTSSSISGSICGQTIN